MSYDPERQRRYRTRNAERIKVNKKRYRDAHEEQIRAADRIVQARRRAEFQGRLDAIKMDRGCIDCGYRSHPRALDFDHRDPTSKTMAPSKMIRLTAKWERIEAEIAKCDVRCANCHRVRTAEENHYVSHPNMAAAPAANTQGQML